MTPVVFLIAGVFFVMTAMTYAEATANFPEAGGASSFARRAFNELASFFAGWAQILNYVITVVDLGVLRAALPGGVLARRWATAPATCSAGS